MPPRPRPATPRHPRIRLAGPIALATLAAGLWTGCVRDPDPFTVPADDVAVHVVLEAGADSVIAIVERPGDPVEDAIVRLVRGADTTWLTFDADACASVGYWGGPVAACHRAPLDAPIPPGSAWELEIVLPDGHRITGATTVPPILSITAPEVGDHLVVRCDGSDTCYGVSRSVPPYYQPVLSTVLRWSPEGVIDADRMFGYVRPVRTFLGSVEYGPEEGCSLGYTGSIVHAAGTRAGEGADSLVVTIPNIVCHDALATARFDSIHAEVVVLERNREYHAYMDALWRNQSARQSHLTAGLEGAWGVFGAITPTPVPVTLLRDPPPSSAPSAP